METSDIFKREWERVRGERGCPTRLRNIVEMGFEAFQLLVSEGAKKQITEVVESIFSGNIIILKETMPKDFLRNVRQQLHQLGTKTDPEYYKMIEGCPDYHRLIDADVAKNYSFVAIKHSYYFFPWNEDRFNLLSETYKRWSTIKIASGLSSDAYKNNTPKNGIVDRLQVVHYPSGAGRIETHSDPYKIQPIIISGIMSKRGEDYKTGGVYFIDLNDTAIDVEDRLDPGDWIIYAPTVLHGVKTVDEHVVPDWTLSSGRWWFGPFSNASNEVKNRHTGYAVKGF